MNKKNNKLVNISSKQKESFHNDSLEIIHEKCFFISLQSQLSNLVVQK